MPSGQMGGVLPLFPGFRRIRRKRWYRCSSTGPDTAQIELHLRRFWSAERHAVITTFAGDTAEDFRLWSARDPRDADGCGFPAAAHHAVDGNWVTRGDVKNDPTGSLVRRPTTWAISA